MDTSRYADLFLTESREHLSAINASLLEIERGGGAEPMSALFRAVHTVKGMSATMGYSVVAELSHELETLLDGMRAGRTAVTPALMDLLFRAADLLERAVERAVDGTAGDDPDVAALVRQLRAAVRGADDLADARVADVARHDASSAPGWSAIAPGGAGVVVRVRIASDVPLRGVRAYIAIQKAATLGRVGQTSPAMDAIQSDAFGADFALRLETGADRAEIERQIRSAGDVEAVEVEAPPAALAPVEPVDAAVVASAAPAPSASLAPQRNVRIDLRRLDALMNLIGELVITRGRLAEISASLGDPALDEAVGQASRLIADLQSQIMTSRMVPVRQVFDRFPRMVRDTARSLGKDVEFTVVGQEIELDRSMLDEIGDPIVHLLRNAVDHGLESADGRRAAAKPAAGRLTLSAERDRSAVVIRVSDDGRGIDRAKVLDRARRLGLVEHGRDELSDDELMRLVARPGFSTAERVTDVSGRGVGVDAVQTRVRALGGTLEMRSASGEGTTVTVRLPLTLAIVRALLARVAGETYALPLTHVNETVELTPAMLRTVRGREVLVLREDVIPLLRLRELVRMDGDDPGRQVVVLEAGERRAALVVDELTGQQEIVVKQFDAVRDAAALFGGATILGDGAPALIVDVGSLL